MPCWRFEAGAAFSACGRYRWLLRRSLDSTRASGVLFIGLNPSRANGERDDPTLRRLQGFARSWGYGQLVVLNLFALVTPSPALLRRSSDPTGAAADAVLAAWLRRWSLSQAWDLWLGWGAGGTLWRRDQQLVEMVQSLMRQRRAVGGSPPGVLGITRGGQPRHPLYVPGRQTLQPWIQADEPPSRHPGPMASGGTVRR